MNMNTDTTRQISELKEKLAQVRQESLAAVNKNDYRLVARLTVDAANINRALSELMQNSEPGLVEDRGRKRDGRRSSNYFSAAVYC